jgi:hypothetical protein
VDPVPVVGVLAGTLGLAGVVAGAAGALGVVAGAGAGALCALPVLDAAESGSGDGPVPTAKRAATTETPAAAALTDAMVRSRNRCSLDAAAAATVAAPAAPAAAATPVT